MASAAGLRAGRAYVELGVDNNRLSAGLRAAANQVKAFSGSLRAVGMGVAGLGASIAAPLAGATATFAGFEKSMARVRALLSLEKESKSFQELTKHARFLGENTAFSASQAGNAMVELAQSGMNASQILAATAPLLNLAEAGAVDLATAARISQEVMHGLKLEAGDTARIADMLASSMSNSSADVISLGEAFSYIGTQAGALGMSMEETAAAIEILSNAGIKGSRAGTGLLGALQSLINPAAEAKEVMQKLGIQLKNEQGGFRGLAAVIKDLNRATAGMGDVDREQTLGMLFTNRQTTGVSALLAKPEELEERTARVHADKGKAAAMGKVQMDTIYGAWKLIESAVEGVAITIGNELMPTIREWATTIIDGVGIFGAILKENKAWLPTIAKTAAGLLIAGGALTAIGIGALGVGAVLGGLATAGTMVVGAVGGIVGAVGMLFTPVGAITALVVGGIAAWMRYTESGQAAARSIGGAISSMVTSVGNLLGSMAETFTQAWGGIVDAVKAGNLSLAGDIAWKGLMVVWQKGTNWLRELWRGFSFYFVETFYQATTDLAHGLNNVWSGLEKFWFASFSTLRAGWNTTIDAIRKSYLMGVYNMKIAWLDWQHTVGAISKHTLTLEKTIAWTGDAEKGTEGTRQALEAITKERRAAEEKDKKALEEIESRRKAVEVGMDREHADGMAARERERNAARKKDLEELVQLEKELADAIKQANDAAAMARWEKTGSWFGFEDQAPTKKGLDAVAERATGMGASGGSAGTFDANVLRFLAGTGNKDLMQKRQLEEAEQTNRRLERLIDIARDNKNTYT